MARVPLQNRFRLAIIIPGKCKYILLNKNVRTCNYLQCTCKYIPQGLSDGFHVVPRGFRWFPLVPAGSPWLYLVIPGYPWLYLVILGYTWLSTIQIYVKSLRICNLLSIPSFAEIFCSRGQIKWPLGNQG